MECINATLNIEKGYIECDLTCSRCCFSSDLEHLCLNFDSCEEDED